MFGALCYPTNEGQDLGKLRAKADIGVFVGYASNKKGYRIYNKRTRNIMETIHVTFDELTGQMAPVQFSSGPALQNSPIGSSLVPNSSQETPYVPPSEDDLKKLFDPMFDELYDSISNEVLIPTTEDAHIPVNEVNPSVSISLSQEAPAADHSVSSTNHHSSNVHHGTISGINDEVNPFATPEDAPFENIFATPESSSEPSSSGDIDSATSVPQQLPHEHLRKWTHDHPLDNIIGNPSLPVSTHKQPATDALWCFFNSVLSKIHLRAMIIAQSGAGTNSHTS